FEVVMRLYNLFFFFFSSRRRHTRSKRDWSSDVCSSDLYESTFIGVKESPISNELSVSFNDGEEKTDSNNVPKLNFTYGAHASTKIGRASCRERGEISVVGGDIKRTVRQKSDIETI